MAATAVLASKVPHVGHQDGGRHDGDRGRRDLDDSLPSHAMGLRPASPSEDAGGDA